jgi:hypothetical protein
VVLMQVRMSSAPAQVARSAGQLGDCTGDGYIPILVVPYMTAAGAETADRLLLNWIDLSGNARVRAQNLYVLVQGRPNAFPARGRPSSPFAPRSSRVTRQLLSGPQRWWTQKELAGLTALDDGSVSRTVRRLDEQFLLERRARQLRPSDPDLLLDAWAQDYRFDAHDIVPAHLSGSGIEAVRTLAARLEALNVRYALTGLPAAWLMDHFARFRLITVYINGDPRDVADHLDARREPAGANVQLVGPADTGVFAGAQDYDGLRCVTPVQAYLDLLHLPERAAEAAQRLRARHLRWREGGGE